MLDRSPCAFFCPCRHRMDVGFVSRQRGGWPGAFASAGGRDVEYTRHTREWLEKPADVGLDRGPSPFWIWGASDDNTYYLKTTFKGGSTAARFKASCDNQVTIFLNGRQIAAHDEWEVPLEVDVQKHVLPGRNELIAEVTNQGGPAGFLFKLALKDSDGKIRYIVSDASWTAAPRRDSNDRSPVRLVAPLGQGPWGDPLRGPSTLAAPRNLRGLAGVPRRAAFYCAARRAGLVGQPHV